MKKAALFIGINTYANGISPLKYAMGDASDLNAEFSSGGFRTRLLCDHSATGEAIVAKTKELMQELHAGDIFVFYFSGHGYFAKDQLHLLGVSAEAALLDAGYGMLPLPVIEKLTCKPGVKRFFILDCCQNALHAGGKAIALCQKPVECTASNGGELPLILTSCSVGEISFEDPASGHSLFTNAVLNTLRSSTAGTISAFLLSLKHHMSSAVQHPCISGNIAGWENVPLFGTTNVQEETAPPPPPPVNTVPETFHTDSLDAALHDSECGEMINLLQNNINFLRQAEQNEVIRNFAGIQTTVADNAKKAFAAGNRNLAMQILADNRQECTRIAKQSAAKGKYDHAAIAAAFADQSDPEIIKIMVCSAGKIIPYCPEFYRGLFYYDTLFGDSRLNWFLRQSFAQLPAMQRFSSKRDFKIAIRTNIPPTFGMRFKFALFIISLLITYVGIFLVLLIDMLNNFFAGQFAYYDPELYGKLFLKNVHRLNRK